MRCFFIISVAIVFYLSIYIYYDIYTLQQNIYDSYKEAGLNKPKVTLLTCDSCELIRIDCGYENINACWVAEGKKIIDRVAEHRKRYNEEYERPAYTRRNIYQRFKYNLWKVFKGLADYASDKQANFLYKDGPPFALYHEESIRTKIMGSLHTIFLKISFRL